MQCTGPLLFLFLYLNLALCVKIFLARYILLLPVRYRLLPLVLASVHYHSDAGVAVGGGVVVDVLL